MIHPFADGNGRIGRLLISWTLNHHLGLAVPPPVSVAFLRDVGGYLSGLTLYRTVGPDPWIRWFASTVERAATSATKTLATAADLVASWPTRLAARAALIALEQRGVLRQAHVPGTGEPGRPRTWWVAGELIDLLAR